MEHLDISRDVLLQFRTLCRDGGETEDQVLRRLLENTAGGSTRYDDGDGFTDATYDIHFPQGSEIFRIYKGRPFAARVVRGRWLLDADGRSYDSLNQLSQGVIDGNENAWMFWFTQNPGGAAIRIADLRDPALVQKRPRRRKASPARQAVARQYQAAAAPPMGQATQAQRLPPAPAQPSRPPAGEPGPDTVRGGGMPWEPAET